MMMPAATAASRATPHSIYGGGTAVGDHLEHARIGNGARIAFALQRELAFVDRARGVDRENEGHVDRLGARSTEAKENQDCGEERADHARIVAR